MSLGIWKTEKTVQRKIQEISERSSKNAKKGTKKVQTKVKNSVIKPNNPRQEYSEDFKKTAIQHF